jgi:DNA-binding XRE family transcriptional regulator
MAKKELSPFDRDTLKRIAEDSDFAEAFFEELSERPLSVQLAFLRRMNGHSQMKLATRLRINQGFLSRLEKEGSDHLISFYEKLAKLMHARLALIPEGYRILPPLRR